MSGHAAIKSDRVEGVRCVHPWKNWLTFDRLYPITGAHLDDETGWWIVVEADDRQRRTFHLGRFVVVMKA